MWRCPLKRHAYIQEFYAAVSALIGETIEFDFANKGAALGSEVDEAFFRWIQAATNARMTLDIKPNTKPSPQELLRMCSKRVAVAACYTETPSDAEWKEDSELRRILKAFICSIFEARPGPTVQPPTVTSDHSAPQVAVVIATNAVGDLVTHQLMCHPEHAIMIAELMARLTTPEERGAALIRIVQAQEVYTSKHGVTECPPIEVFRELIRNAVQAPLTPSPMTNTTLN